MTNYSRGADFEREVMKIFRDAGFDVARMAGSKGKFAGMPTDVIVSKNTGQTLYEVGICFGWAAMQMKTTKAKKKVKAAGYQ